MKKLSIENDPQICDYISQTFVGRDPILEEIRGRAERAGLPDIHVCDYDGLHLEVLARAVQARRIVEIGALAGYSGVCLARALPADGRLYTFDINPENAFVARESFRRAGVSEKVEIFVGPALENLPQIERKGPFDLVFIDADKANYPHYAKWAYKNLRMGGMIIGDNTFAFGEIARSDYTSEQKPSVVALREFNQWLAQSGLFRTTILPTGEGMTVAIKIK